MTAWAERYPWATSCALLPPEAYLQQQSRPRAEWGPGPWQSEPDIVRFVTFAGPRGLIWRAPVTGSLCGYAEVKPGHPFFCKHWRQLEIPIEVHGGLTFGGTFPPDGLKHDEPDEWLDSWWLGFDCGHFDDLMPALNALLADLRHPRRWPKYAARGVELPPPVPACLLGGHYWTIDEVRDESEDLARQIVAADNPGVREMLAALRAREEVDDP